MPNDIPFLDHHLASFDVMVEQLQKYAKFLGTEAVAKYDVDMTSYDEMVRAHENMREAFLEAISEAEPNWDDRAYNIRGQVTA